MFPKASRNGDLGRIVAAARSVSLRLVSRLLILLFGLAFSLGSPAAVAAHAELLLASPAPGTGLAQAPAAVVIKFSEPLNLTLSRIQVLDASGTDVGQGPTLEVPGDAEAMRRPLGLLPTGPYVVRWRQQYGAGWRYVTAPHEFEIRAGELVVEQG